MTALHITHKSVNEFITMRAAMWYFVLAFGDVLIMTHWCDRSSMWFAVVHFHCFEFDCVAMQISLLYTYVHMYGDKQKPWSDRGIQTEKFELIAFEAFHLKRYQQQQNKKCHICGGIVVDHLVHWQMQASQSNKSPDKLEKAEKSNQHGWTDASVVWMYLQD